MKPRSLLLALFAAAALFAPPAGAQLTPTVWTITVDCSAGQSINSALEQSAQLLTVEVRGECQEDVVIRRDDVVLRGADARRDGIRSPGAVEGSDAALTIRDARRVTVANLRISGGVREGLHVLNSTDDIIVSDSRLDSNGVWGASIGDSTVAFIDVSFSGNGLRVVDSIGGGLIAARGSEVACSECLIELNPESGVNFGAVAFTGSTLRLSDSRVEGQTAVLAQSYARAMIESTELEGAVWSFQANSYGSVQVRGGTLSGPFLAKSYSTVELMGATQVLNQLQNFITESSKLVADRLESNELETTLAGLTLVADFSTGRIVNGTAAESLVCTLGGELFCDGTEIKGSVMGCPACPIGR